MTILNKLKWIFGMLLIFLLVLATNLIDRNNFLRIKDSTVNIYEDRLIAKSIIYDLVNQVHRKEIALTKSDSNYYRKESEASNTLITQLLEQFFGTKLTKKEKILLTDLKENVGRLNANEKNLSYTDEALIKKQIALINTIKGKLDSLAIIQLEEGKRQVMISDRAASSIELFTQIEIYFLIALALIVQFLIMYKPKGQR